MQLQGHHRQKLYHQAGCDNDRAALLPSVAPVLAQLNEREATLFHPGRWSYAAYAALREQRATLLAEALRGLQGHQFEPLPSLSLEAGAHRVYVIQKVRRTNRQTTQPMAIYTIVDGVIRRAPDLYTLVESRLAKTAYHLGRVVEIADELSQRREARLLSGGALPANTRAGAPEGDALDMEFGGPSTDY